MSCFIEPHPDLDLASGHGGLARSTLFQTSSVFDIEVAEKKKAAIVDSHCGR